MAAKSPGPETAPEDLMHKRTAARGYDLQYHGTAEFRGGNCPHSRYYDKGRFGRLFPNLPQFRPDPAALRELGKVGGPMDGGTENPDSPTGLPAGFTFLGQFVDHDITFDPTSSLERQNDPEAIANFRTPSLELDSVYASGPGASPHLYQRANRNLLLIGTDTGGGRTDLPRNSEGTALTGDPRNDENIIVSQLHVAFLRFHNRIVARVEASPPIGRSVFEDAQRLVRWNYQWIIVNEFLPHIVGRPLVDQILEEGPRYYRPRHEPFIPVEFAVAAYRFGHSQVRPGYGMNAAFGAPIFAERGSGAPDLSSGRVLDAGRVIDWSLFFGIGDSSPQLGKAIDTSISSPLLALPFPSDEAGDPASLATRNLLRGREFGLPSGQDVARFMGEVPLTAAEVGAEAGGIGFDHQTPLWFYILKEAEVRTNRHLLGPVGGRIVAEVLLGLLTGDRLSYLRANPTWEPDGDAGGVRSMAELVNGPDREPTASSQLD